MAHEIYHLILNHLERMEDKDQETWNQATDFAINWSLKEDGFTVTSSSGFGDGGGILLDQKHSGKGATQIYKEILQTKKENRQKFDPGGDPSKSPSKEEIEGLVQTAIASDPKNNKTLEEQIESNKQKAEKAQKEGSNQQGYRGRRAGNNPRGQDRLIFADVLRIVIEEKTYEEIFEKYLTDPLSGGKRTYMRPSRRPYKGTFRLKGKYPKKGRKNRLIHLVYCLDVSGSISEHQTKQFIASATTIKERLNPVRMTVILWDTSIVYEKTFREDEPLGYIKVRAGGGTSLGPVYKRLEQLNPEAAVIFTDLEVSIPPKPEWETIWFTTEKTCRTQHVTYGDLIPEK